MRGDNFVVNKRVISAVIAIPILLLFVIKGGILFKIGIMAITAIALYEYINAYQSENIIKSSLLIGYILQFFILLYHKSDLILPVILLITLISMAAPIFKKKYSVVSSALTITGFIYIVVFFGILISIREYSNGGRVIWLVFIIAFFCDTAAYYTGRYFGKKKLCPEVSPKKTVEGAIGGIIASAIGVIVWGFINKDIHFEWYQLIILGIIGGMISQIGDLSASLIKRYVGIKDYGNIMPGHGGVLDRFDSILFTAPIVYYFMVFFWR